MVKAENSYIMLTKITYNNAKTVNKIMNVKTELGFILIVFSITLTGCGYAITKTPETPKKVTFVIESKPNNLEYDCNNFQPQAKTGDDIQAVGKRAYELTYKSVTEEKNVVAGNEFKSAQESKDIPRMEKIAVTLGCKELLKK